MSRSAVQVMSSSEVQAPRKRMLALYPRGNGYCGRYVMYHGKKGTYWPNMCGGRNCSHKECRMQFARRRIDELQNLVEDNNLNRFFTLTLDPKKEGLDTPEKAWEAIAGIWSKMRKRIAREYPDAKWVCVLEKHKKTDYPHIHGFIDTFIDCHWLCMKWQACGGGLKTDIEKVDKDIVEYVGKQLEVCKYVGKDNINVGQYVAPRKRIMWKSYDLKVRKVVKADGIGFVKNKKTYSEEGEKILTEERISGNINLDITQNHKEDELYATRQVWKDMERSGKKGDERSGKGVASNPLENKERGENKESQREERKDKQRDQEVSGQIESVNQIT